MKMKKINKIVVAVVAVGCAISLYGMGQVDLFQLVENNDVDQIEQYIADNRKVNADVRNQFQETPLMEAANGGQTRMVNALIALGASVNARDVDRNTALILGARGEQANVETVKALLGAGAAVNVPNRNGDTPIALAARAGKTAIVRELLKKKELGLGWIKEALIQARRSPRRRDIINLLQAEILERKRLKRT